MFLCSAFHMISFFFFSLFGYVLQSYFSELNSAHNILEGKIRCLQNLKPSVVYTGVYIRVSSTIITVIFISDSIRLIRIRIQMNPISILT